MKQKARCYLILWFVLLVTGRNTNAQNTDICWTSQYVQKINASNLLYKNNIREWEQQIQQWLQSHPYQKTKGIYITIPIAVHIVYKGATQNISDQSILDNIATLNEDFQKLNADTTQTPSTFKNLIGNAQIEFCIASQAPDGSPTNGIERKTTTISPFITASNFDADPIKFDSLGGFDAWPQDQYYNLWICDIAPGVQGYGAGTIVPVEYDGVVLDYGTVKKGSRTLTHETGHWLNLYHIFNDTTTCGDDGVADTPIQQQANNGCPAFPHVTCSNGPDGDLYVNYMDYSNCTAMFTKGQVARMQANLNHPRRSPLFTSQGCAQVSGINKNNKILEIEVYPNPTKGFLNFKINERFTENTSVKLYDVLGNLVIEKIFENSLLSNHAIDISDQPNGMYWILIQTNRGMYNKKVALFR